LRFCVNIQEKKPVDLYPNIQHLLLVFWFTPRKRIMMQITSLFNILGFF
jgi:hypothetical protein